ncbi:hypothetical protein AB685_00435 [Bacillus sp. LL01]|nr:hypothetical protein AB685_00435 [Bacillus sp. LL01]
MNEEIEALIGYIDEYVNETTNWITYRAMDDATKERYRKKLVLNVVFAFAPRRNYDISMATISEWVDVMLKVGAEVDKGDENGL